MRGCPKKCIPPWEVQSRLAYKRRKTFTKNVAFSRPQFKTFMNRCYQAITRQHSNILCNSADLHGINEPPLVSYDTSHKDLVKIEKLDDGVLNQSFAHPSTDGSDDATAVDIGQVFEDLNIRLQYIGYIGPNKHDKRLIIGFVNRIAEYLTDSTQCFKFLCSMVSVVNARVRSTALGDTSNIKVACKESFELMFARLDDNVSPYHCVMCYLKLCTFYGQNVKDLPAIYHKMVTKIVYGDVFITENELDNLLYTFQKLAVCDGRILDYYSERIANHFDCFSDDEVCNFARYLVKSLYARDKLDEFGASVDYSREFSASEIKELLDGFDVKSSAYLRCLESKMPTTLHQYTYFNLIDLGEFYHIFNIQSEVIIRFSTELWKYLYTLQYGYPIKSLVVLSKLGLSDCKTFGRLIRNIPQTLAFRWPLNLVAECLICLDGAKSEKIYVILAHYLVKSLSASFNPRSTMRIFDSLRLKGVVLTGFYQKVLNIQANNPKWLNHTELLSAARYAKEVGLCIKNAIDIIEAKGVSELNCQQAIQLLFILDGSYQNIAQNCLHTINRNSNDGNIGYEELVTLLMACKKQNVWLTLIPQLALKALQQIEAMDVIATIELLEMLSFGGPLSNVPLLEKLEKYINDSIPDLQLRSTGKVLCAALNNLDGHTQDMRVFLRHISQFKDVSWRREADEIQKIAHFKKNLGCRAYVSVFPFTADIEVSTYDLLAYIGDKKHYRLAIVDQAVPTTSQSPSSSGVHGSLLLDLCGNPYITVIDQEGNTHQTFKFYYKLRNRLVNKPFAHLLEATTLKEEWRKG
uniref:Uncharacterized protein n=1 Tax=Babesia bovis TaxID=5865 RepID=A7ASE3_BABBO|eukprot:XP_001611030.1 hypothetical protein [Babesia bovis T2Bo]